MGFQRTAVDIKRVWCAGAAFALLVFAIVSLTQCDGSLFCQVLSGFIIFGGVIGIIGALFINHLFMALFMGTVFVCIIAEIVLIVMTFMDSNHTTNAIAFGFVVLACLIITLGFASDLRHTIVLNGYGGGRGGYNAAPQTTIINNGMPAPMTTTTVIQ